MQVPAEFEGIDLEINVTVTTQYPGLSEAIKAAIEQAMAGVTGLTVRSEVAKEPHCIFPNQAEALEQIEDAREGAFGTYIDLDHINVDDTVKIDGWISSVGLEAIVYLMRGGQ